MDIGYFLNKVCYVFYRRGRRRRNKTHVADAIPQVTTKSLVKNRYHDGLYLEEILCIVDKGVLVFWKYKVFPHNTSKFFWCLCVSL